MATSVKVLFFASAREAAGCQDLTLPSDGESWSEADLWARLEQKVPALAAQRSSVRLARNQEYLSANGRIFPGDEVAVIPPVSGG